MGIVPQLCVPTTGKFLTKAIVEIDPCAAGTESAKDGSGFWKSSY